MSEQALVSQKMSPEKRVAVVLASLDPEVAALVMKELEPNVMTRAAESIRNLGIVPGTILKQALGESLKELRTYNNALHGGDRLAVGLLSRVVGEQQATNMLELGQVAGNRFGALASYRAEEIARMLSAESSSVVALVLRFLPAQLASDSLSHFEDDIRNKVVIQMATAELPQEKVIDQIEKHLVARLPASAKRGRDDSTRLEAVVCIMQRSSKEVQDAMLEELAKTDQALADQVRDQMFVFEDIVNLEDSAVRRIMQELETGILSKALRKASDEAKKAFFGNMSKRAAEGLEEEMSFSGKMAFSEVAKAQKEVVQVARRLAEQGEIQISAQEEEYV